MLHKVGNASKGVCILPVFTVRFPRGWGFNNDNSDFGFPRGGGIPNRRSSAVGYGYFLELANSCLLQGLNFLRYLRSCIRGLKIVSLSFQGDKLSFYQPGPGVITIDP